MIMKKGDRGTKVKNLQTKLNKVVGVNLVVDGVFGIDTFLIVNRFQMTNNLVVDGIVGRKTSEVLNNQYILALESTSLSTFGSDRFVVFVDAGHGGVDDSGKYTTPGKRAYHSGTELHDTGNYYEGYENRIVAEMFIEQLTRIGIQTIRTYHPTKDTSLSERTRLINAYLKRGYYGYLHSFHSNAISSSNTPSKLEQTRGFMVFSTRGDTLSDEIATAHFQNVHKYVNDWKLRTQKREDGDEDFESNFQILRQTDKDLNRFGAILEEWGFHTSREDCEFIISSRDIRVKCAVETAKFVKNKLSK